jgi:hypothetical protein
LTGLHVESKDRAIGGSQSRWLTGFELDLQWSAGGRRNTARALRLFAAIARDVGVGITAQHRQQGDRHE